GYFLFMGTRWVKSIRYFLPIYPFLLLLAAWAVVELWKRAGRRNLSRENGRSGGTPWPRVAAGVLAVLVIVPTFLWAYAFTEVYRQPLTRVTASRWMYENVPTAATLIYERDGRTVELQLPTKGFNIDAATLPEAAFQFTMPEDGTLLAVRLNYVADPDGDDGEGEALTLSLRDFHGNPLAAGEAEVGDRK